jgi:hypothetical protein
LALESLGVQGEPDGFNIDTSSLDKGLELVRLKDSSEKRSILEDESSVNNSKFSRHDR